MKEGLQQLLAIILRMPLSSLLRSEIYCRFVLENPRDVDSAVDLELEDLITAATAVVHMVAILLLYVPNVITWVHSIMGPVIIIFVIC